MTINPLINGKTVVQENCVKSLHANWKPLEQEKPSIVTRTCGDVPAKFAEEIESSLNERTMRLNELLLLLYPRNWLCLTYEGYSVKERQSSVTATTRWGGLFYLCQYWCKQQSVIHCVQRTVNSSWNLPCLHSNCHDSEVRQHYHLDLLRHCVSVRQVNSHAITPHTINVNHSP